MTPLRSGPKNGWHKLLYVTSIYWYNQIYLVPNFFFGGGGGVCKKLNNKMKTENEIIDKLDYATLPRIRIFMILGCSFFSFFFGQDFFDESHSAPLSKTLLFRANSPPTLSRPPFHILILINYTDHDCFWGKFTPNTSQHLYNLEALEINRK